MKRIRIYCRILAALSLIGFLPAYASITDASERLRTARAGGQPGMTYEPQLIAKIYRNAYKAFIACGVQFALFLLLVISLFRRQPQSPRWLWLVAVAGYSFLGIVLLALAVSIASTHTPDTVIDPTAFFLIFIGALLGIWIVPSIVLALRIARHDTTNVA